MSKYERNQIDDIIEEIQEEENKELTIILPIDLKTITKPIVYSNGRTSDGKVYDQLAAARSVTASHTTINTGKYTKPYIGGNYGKSIYTYSIFKQNLTIKFDFMLYTDKEEIFVHKIPTSIHKIIEIVYDKNDFKYSFDSKIEGKKDSYLGKYLAKNLYPKLQDSIFKIIPKTKFHLYGFIGKEGFFPMDLFINDNWFLWEHCKHIFNVCKLRVPELLYSGKASGFDYEKFNSFVLRPRFEDVMHHDIFIKNK